MTVKSKLKRGVKLVNGTAGEAFENSTLESMIGKYGEEATYRVLKPVLEKAGETVDSFKTYRRIKGKVQNDTISIYRAEKNLEIEVKSAIQEELPGALDPSPE